MKLYVKTILIRMGRETSPSRGRYTPSVTPQKPISAARRGAIPKRPKSPEQAIPKKTPGVVNAGHTTVVNITPPSTADQPTDIGTILATNRAMQSISDNLEEQEISESVTVQTKLADLQQARRDFVFAVASIGGSSINLDDISPPSPLSETPPLSPRAALLQVRVQPEYGLDHPDILAARAHMEKIKLNIKAREAAKRAQEELERLAAIEQISDELQLNIPFDDEQFPPTLRQQIPYHHPEFDAEELERFFDVERFPPCPQCGPPPGKEGLHRDLWDLEDPWYIPPQSNEPDLIQFDIVGLTLQIQRLGGDVPRITWIVSNRRGELLTVMNKKCNYPFRILKFTSYSEFTAHGHIYHTSF